MKLCCRVLTSWEITLQWPKHLSAKRTETRAEHCATRSSPRRRPTWRGCSPSRVCKLRTTRPWAGGCSPIQ
ncbi:hypothetical protein WJX73_010096 [Symbiochloris irregularis]|uniref:Uncharacterized protein n=1 Tax=Symbiochloris irregularis TaxID=706552 RepID=A0AAW1P0F9_9CHLO